MIVFDLDVETIEYGYRMDGPCEPGAGPSVRPDQDPARPVRPGHRRPRRVGRGAGLERRLPAPRPTRLRRLRLGGRPPAGDADRRPGHLRDARARLHPRTRRRACEFPGHASRGMREKIPYLKELGINCVELMPIFEFDEFENSRTHPTTGELLLNYWGYSTVGFFAPKAGYAATGKLRHAGRRAEGAGQGSCTRTASRSSSTWCSTTPPRATSTGPSISFRGLDNQHLLHAHARRATTTTSAAPGTRSTATTRSSATWSWTACATGRPSTTSTASASTWRRSSGRDPYGAPLPNPPLLESLAFDPILAKCKLIAEAWDAGGLYQVGSLPGLRPLGASGTASTATPFAQLPQGRRRAWSARWPSACMGSPDLYYGRGTGRVDQLHHLPRRVHARRPGRPTTTSTTRPTARTTSDGANDNNSLELRRRRRDRRSGHQRSCGADRSRTPSPCCWSARACR